MNVLRTVDKIDKIGEENVLSELAELGVTKEAGEKILEFIKIKGSTDEIIKALNDLKIENEVFLEGLDEISQVVGYMRDFGIDENCFDIDLKIARGLDYYTGTVYETTLDNYPNIGSVCSGGRYEDLASYYTDKVLPGVGISIGLSRLFYQLNEAKIISSEEKSLVDLLIIPMDDCLHDGIKLLSELREKGVKVSVYTEFAKLKKKFKYADQTKVDYVIVLGEEEVKSRKYSLKNMKSGDQEEVTFDELVEKFKRWCDSWFKSSLFNRWLRLELLACKLTKSCPWIFACKNPWATKSLQWWFIKIVISIKCDSFEKASYSVAFSAVAA